MSTATVQPVAYLLSFRSTSSLIPIAVELLDELPQTAIYVLPPTRSFASENYAWDSDWTLMLMQPEAFSAALIASVKSRSEGVEMITHRAVWEESDMNRFQERYCSYNLNHRRIA